MVNKAKFYNNMSSKLLQLRAKKWFRWSSDVALFALIISAVMAWQSKDMLSADGSVQIQQQNLVSLQGAVVPLFVNDKPSLIYFFAPWCKICALSIGNLAYINPNKLNVMVIALDYGSKEEVLEFVQRHDVKSTVLMGHDELKSQFLIQGYPSYYMLDKNRNIVSSAYGYSSAVGLKLREAFGD